MGSPFSISALILIVSLGCAPVLYGGTEPWSRDILTTLGLAASAVWLVELAVRRSLPSVPRLTLYAAAALLLMGWLVWFNAHSMHDTDYWEFVPLEPLVSWLPGSVDVGASQYMMMRVTALIGMFLLTCDVARHRTWARALMMTICVAGAGFALFGVYQKISGDPWRIWPSWPPPVNAFSTFWYHGNAAAFLNMVWPIMVGLAHANFRQNGNHLLRAVWIAFAAVTMLGLLLNVSKAGHFMLALLLTGYAAMAVCGLPGTVRTQGWRRPLLWSVLLISALSGAVAWLDWDESLARWASYLARDKMDSRAEVAVLCMPLVQKAGLFGFGPGTFDAVFQHHAAEVGWLNGIRWKFAHNDYLQTVIEWGALGLLTWGLLFFEGVRNAWRCLSRRLRWGEVHESPSNPLYIGLSMSLAGVLLHAAVDFPLQIPGIQIYAAVVLGLLTAKRKDSWVRQRHV
jgi:hypothetical protein